MAKPRPSLPPPSLSMKVLMPDEIAIDINQWAATVSRIQRHISLNVEHRIIRIGLRSSRANHSHGDCVAQAFRTPNCEDQFTLMHAQIWTQIDYREVPCFNFEKG